MTISKDITKPYVLSLPLLSCQFKNRAEMQVLSKSLNATLGMLTFTPGAAPMGSHQQMCVCGPGHRAEGLSAAIQHLGRTTHLAAWSGVSNSQLH